SVMPRSSTFWMPAAHAAHAPSRSAGSFSLGISDSATILAALTLGSGLRSLSRGMALNRSVAAECRSVDEQPRYSYQDDGEAGCDSDETGKQIRNLIRSNRPWQSAKADQGNKDSSGTRPFPDRASAFRWR